MQIVLDSNILFSALIKDSVTRKIILEYDGFFLFPSFIFEELEKHKNELITKSCLSNEEFNKLIQIILNKVIIVSSDVLYKYREAALEIVRDIDINDILFIACALAYPNSVIWSDDKDLKKQTKIRILNTEEIIKTFEK